MTVSILHLVPSLAGGGAERQLVELCSALSHGGVEVHLGYLRGGPNLEAARRCEAVLHALNAAGNHDPLVILQIRRLIQRVQPHIVQTWLLHADVFGGLAARTCGVPWILSERSSAAMYDARLKFGLRRLLGRRATAIVANSEGGAEYWRRAGFQGPLHVVRNIVRRRDAVADSGAPGSSRFIAVGRLSEEKNYPLLFTAFELLLHARPDAMLDVLGDGHLRPILQRQIDASAALRARVRLLGHVDDVEERLGSACAFVSLSRYEGMPNAVLEAMARDCPLVLSDIPAHRELVDDSSARWAAPLTAASVAAAMAHTLQDRDSAGVRAALANQRLDDWSAQRIAAAYTRIYASLKNERTACALS